MFIDTAVIKLQAGNGGDGAVSFHREKFIANGGPDGGNGGNGGDIIFKGDKSLTTLADFKYRKIYKAQNGENGKKLRQTGKSAKPLIIKVPIGTLIVEETTGKIIADISDEEPKIIAKGGKGGAGNMNFSSSTHQAPRIAKPGELGQQLNVKLELKLLADVGIVGFPNVGKSTLISVSSNAKPEIKNYHFTTIKPNLGVVRVADTSFVMADIPGLIKNASLGAGLGHNFLKHIERCRMLIHVVDVSASEGRDPIEDFETINKELENYNKNLISCPMIVAGNKCDLANDDQIAKFKNYVETKGYEFYPIKAAINYNVKPLLNKTAQILSTLPKIKTYTPEATADEILEKLKEKNNKIEVYKNGEKFVLKADALFNKFRAINFDDYENLQYFQNILEKSGAMDKLRQAGAKSGDTIVINDMEFDFIE